MREPSRSAFLLLSPGSMYTQWAWPAISPHCRRKWRRSRTTPRR